MRGMAFFRKDNNWFALYVCSPSRLIYSTEATRSTQNEYYHLNRNEYKSNGPTAAQLSGPQHVVAQDNVEHWPEADSVRSDSQKPIRVMGQVPETNREIRSTLLSVRAFFSCAWGKFQRASGGRALLGKRTFRVGAYRIRKYGNCVVGALQIPIIPWKPFVITVRPTCLAICCSSLLQEELCSCFR